MRKSFGIISSPGYQVKVGLLLEQAQSKTEREGLRLILDASSEAAAHSERLRKLSEETLNP
jgi:hypothetical protein